jgi:hypothetical protein
VAGQQDREEGVSAGDRRIIYGEYKEQRLLVRETKDGFLFDVYEDGMFSSMDLTTEQTALLVKWLLDRTGGTD